VFNLRLFGRSRERLEGHSRGAVVACVLSSSSLLAISIAMVQPALASTSVSTCALDSLHFDPFTAQMSGLGHGVYIVRVQNVGTVACALSGFPRVRFPLEDHRDPTVQRSLQKVMPPGSTAPIHDTLSVYGGGYGGPTMRGGHVQLPVVVLTPHKGFASFAIGWAETSPTPCPVSRLLELGLVGDAKFWTTRQFAFVRSGVDVTPFVSGIWGSWS